MNAKNCLCCLQTNKEILIDVFGEEGLNLKVLDVLSKHFWFEMKEKTAQNICKSCWKQVDDFHRFYCFIEKTHQHSSLNPENKENEPVTTYLDESHVWKNVVKSEYLIPDYSDHLEEMAVVHPSEESERYEDLMDSAGVAQYSKKRKKNSNKDNKESLRLPDTGGGNQYYYNDFFELTELNDPGGTAIPQDETPVEELERLRNENSRLKQQNEKLLNRLKESLNQNKINEKINHELSAKLSWYKNHTDHAADLPIDHVEQRLMIPLTDAIVHENGDVLILDSVIPSHIMAEIDSTEIGEKNDTRYVAKLAVVLWGNDHLARSSVTGKKSSKQTSENYIPSIQLEPQKVNFIREKLYNRVIRETNSQVAAMSRFEDSRVNRLLNIKIQNLKKQMKSRSE